MEDKIAEVQEWFNGVLAAQSKLEKHEDPVIKADEINKKIKNVKKLLDKVKSKKKPKPKKEKKEEEKAEEEKAEGEKAEGEKADGEEKPQEEKKDDL